MQPALCYCTVLAQGVCRVCGVVPLCASHAGRPCPACSQRDSDHYRERVREYLDKILSSRLSTVDIFLSEPVTEKVQWRYQGYRGSDRTIVSEPDGIAYLVEEGKGAVSRGSSDIPALLLSSDRQWLMTGEGMWGAEFRRTVFGKSVPVGFLPKSPYAPNANLYVQKRFVGYRAEAVAPIADFERCASKLWRYLR